MKIENQIKSLNKHMPAIKKASEKFAVDEKLLLSIAILENINRPSWLRFFEKLIPNYIFAFRSYGLMQVKSDTYLNDKESIFLAAKLLSVLDHNNDPFKLGKLYNGSNEYGICLNYVYSEILRVGI